MGMGQHVIGWSVLKIDWAICGCPGFLILTHTISKLWMASYHGHLRSLNWRYLPYIRLMWGLCEGYVRPMTRLVISPQQIVIFFLLASWWCSIKKNMKQYNYIHITQQIFRIEEWHQRFAEIRTALTFHSCLPEPKQQNIHVWRM